MDDSTCSVDGCARGGKLRRGWCDLHYDRWLRNGEVGPAHKLAPGLPQRTCSLDGCDARHEGKGLCRKHYVRKFRTRWSDGIEEECVCEWCDAVFMARTQQGRRGRFCSQGCLSLWKAKEYSSSDAERRAAKLAARARRRSRERHPGFERFDPVEIYDRDGWRCGICSRPIGRSYRSPHPRSASIDHIVPLAVGGLHVRANVQASHRECNGKKRHTGPGQLRLVG